MLLDGFSCSPCICKVTQDLKTQLQQYRNKYESWSQKVCVTMKEESVYWGRDLGESIQDHWDAQQELGGHMNAVKSIVDQPIGNVF